jgi:thymidylate synthase ThyX
MPTVKLVDARSQTIDKLAAFEQGQGDALSDGQRAEVRKIINFLKDSPEQTASNAGRECYEKESPALDAKKLDVEKKLWKTGHHTTMMHTDQYFTFAIDGIAVSDITFGFHNCNPFYNSDQRSGRYSKMYDEMEDAAIKKFTESQSLYEIKNRIREYYPHEQMNLAMDLIKRGADIYHENKDQIVEVAGNVLRQERPNVSDEYIARNAKKLAQEQLRVFISMAVPTSFYYTINLPALAAFHRTAWTPGMRDVVGQMVSVVLDKYPNLDYMFTGSPMAQNVHFCEEYPDNNVFTSPYVKILRVNVPRNYSIKNPLDYPKDIGLKKPVWKNADTDGSVSRDGLDLRHFSPQTMGDDIYSISMHLAMSVMTLGHDQRHRTLHRGLPTIGGSAKSDTQSTGSFYLPPLPKIAGLYEAAQDFSGMWCDLIRRQPYIANYVIPYGARVSFDKVSPLNGLIHEQEKRNCINAQEEIANIGLKMVRQLADAKMYHLVSECTPLCAKQGKCVEGDRYCGRDISEWNRSLMTGFRERQI